MTKRSRKSKKRVNKQPKSPTVVSPLRKLEESTPLPPGVAKLDPDRTVISLKEIFIEASTEFCFDILSKQLEQPPEWDPVIVHARPVSNVRDKIGATSQVTLDLGGKKVESQAMISRYHPDRAVSWVFTRRPKVREDWQLERKPHGTQVRVTLAHEFDGWVIGRLIYKVMRRKRVEQDLDKMLAQLKETVESISCDQQRFTGGVKS
jgi:uncharacterized membrane protein